MVTNFKKINHCVCCGNARLDSCLDLGTQPLANNLLDQDQRTDSFTLQVNLCTNCWHLQQDIAVDPNLMFNHYLYVSGTSNTLLDYFDWFAQWCKTTNPQSTTVLDIACNDGSQLNSFKRLGYDTFGADPAKNLSEISSQNHQVYCGFFNEATIEYFSHKKMDLIVAQNVLAHTADPLNFLLTAKKFMTSDSKLVVQTSQANMVPNKEFDTVYHEHISFFSVHSMQKLVHRANLHLNNVYTSAVHGTSYIFEIGINLATAGNVESWIQTDIDKKLTQEITYKNWASNAQFLLEDLHNTCVRFQTQGFQLWGIGAAAKGITMLNAGGLRLSGIFDENPLKVGKYIPGCCTEIYDLNHLKNIEQDHPILFVCLAWNYMPELSAKIKKVRDTCNDRIVTYFPHIQIQNL
jgi:hypothetical protein